MNTWQETASLTVRIAKVSEREAAAIELPKTLLVVPVTCADGWMAMRHRQKHE